MLGIIIAIASATFLALAQIILKKSYKEFAPSVAFMFDALFGVLIWIPIGFIFGANMTEILRCLPYAVISAILSEAFYFYALSKGNLSIATLLLATYPVYTLIFSFLINHEIMSSFQLAVIVTIIVGSVLSCVDDKEKLKDKDLFSLIPLFAAMAVGLSDTLTKTIVNQTSSFNFLIAIAIVQIPVAIIYLIIEKQKPKEIITELKILQTEGTGTGSWCVYFRQFL